ncbi:MAG: hypothetical protein HOE53_01590 [Candidatus Magasanikbacteria bacterium]|nr:hypothetical protein [Candidatus Magasanikbacteria bacterium]
MNESKIQALALQARHIMQGSTDPIHDEAHVARVVAHVRTICAGSDLSEEQKQAVQLAAWWHDCGRTVTKRPSILLMPFLDDLISALMLWRATIRLGLFGPVTGMATRMIACKSLGTGKILTQLMMKKKNHVLISILEDADTLDVIHSSRLEHIMNLAESSAAYKFGYRLSIWWFLSQQKLTMKTETAKKQLLELLHDFILLLQQPAIYARHCILFGEQWTKMQIEKAQQFILTLQTQ